MGSVPMDPVLRLEVARSPSDVTAVELLLPSYRVVDPPKTYRYPSEIALRMSELVRSSQYKPVEDRFNLEITYGGSVLTAFIVETPTASDLVTMKPMRSGERAVGDASALVFRVQRIALSGVTGAYRAGWIVITVSTQFPIDLI